MPTSVLWFGRIVHFARGLACLIVLSSASFAAGKLAPDIPKQKWQWVHTSTTYYPTGKNPLYRSWDSLRGEVTFAVHNGRFEIMIGDAKNGTDTLVKGLIHGRQVSATAVPNQTDEPPRRYTGTFDEDFGAKRISLVSQGHFIGLICQARPGSEAHD